MGNIDALAAARIDSLIQTQPNRYLGPAMGFVNEALQDWNPYATRPADAQLQTLLTLQRQYATDWPEPVQQDLGRQIGDLQRLIHQHPDVVGR